eukprot:CAMPEP_0204909700 /NCGR_PEP_ID=MMETSP1397-20131031/8371_1 /ASSEMBLY_ACC=CAM_ASM_000891 /TAXON_ID=49980 /ORGANISM="Climacostomum Climacostomum virens, Strain Stock W-24" /LENGTH=201 /DNA_ID=CAMNT_0052079611 /DNA_START=193 /DNA_END=795 /DNA_ORIENTATION=-
MQPGSKTNASRELSPMKHRVKPASRRRSESPLDSNLPKKRRAQPLELKTERPPLLAEPESQRKRNERLMNSMLGHLKKAKTVLESQQDTINVQREVTAKKRTEEELQEKEWRAEEEKKKEEQRLAALAKKKLLGQKQEAADLDQLSEKIGKLTDIRLKFFRTSVQPPVFWIPKQVNAKTEASKLRSQAELEEERNKLKQAV